MGGGLMGTGIAQVSAQANQKIALVDLSQDILTKAEKRITESLRRVAKKKFKDDSKSGEEFTAVTMANLSFVTSSESVLGTADLIVEAITENLPLKQKLFSEWDKLCPEKTIFATNTSYLKVGEVMKDVSRLDRCGGLHFFNPVPVMKLLEVVRIPQTSDATFAAMSVWGQNIGKHTVACKDTHGFIVNRLLGPYMADAIAMVERGDATYQDVDAAVKLGLGYPMGPFELLDYVGIDIHKFINDNAPEGERKPSPLIDRMVAEGKLGMKTGEGFYKYPKK
jgi:3-hydroxyacyl-CoA dehydrogenase